MAALPPPSPPPSSALPPPAASAAAAGAGEPAPDTQLGLWWLPMLLALIFVALAIVWLSHDDQVARDEQQATLITDALSLESTLRGVVVQEQQRLELMAQRLGKAHHDRRGLPRLQNDEQLLLALRRGWVSVTWLNAEHRIVQEVPESQSTATQGESSGMSVHLHAPVRDAHGATQGELIARLQAAELLRQYVPWWLARRYEVRLVDALGQEISGADDRPQGLASADTPPVMHRISFDPPLPGISIELTARDTVKAWHQRLPLLLIVGFLVLIVWASLLLRRQMQRVLQASSAWRTEAGWRRAMEDSMQVGLRARDLDGTLLYVNRMFANLVGLPAEQLVGVKVPYPYWLPDDIEGAMIRHRRNLAGGAPPGGYEASWRHSSGRVVRVMVLDAPLIDAAGEHVGWMGSVLDITEMRAAEERERRQFEQLAHHARLTTLGEIASTLAHELNQPLTVMSSYSAGLENALRARGITDPDIVGALQSLGEHAAQAGRIVARIREFLSRHETRNEPVNLERVASQAGELLDHELQKRQVDWRLIAAPGLAPVRGDPVLLEQVLINLMRNAADAMAYSERREIEVRLGAAGPGFARIDVRDTGPGLQGRSARELCQPFYSTKTEGMGLGLAICRSLVEAHQGEFDAADAPGGGALFSVTLPFWHADASESDESEEPMEKAPT
ncbi:MAG: ATP-binding protein [Burkholderiaceae bacterium]